MTELLEVYKCEKCGNVVKIAHAGDGELVCCGAPMVRMEEKTADVGKEKHVPVLEKVEGGVKVKVGDVPHPMEEKHYIEWIEVRKGRKLYVHKLNPGDAPEAVFPIDDVNAKARIYCNIHGLWTNRK
ncbi:desulfoferrodoxin [Methanofollis tationis]|uniref:Desulfoferrodoxin n=1 Tax=Methanofollis tationis TaxID=81417 RepID=A0A7K4HRW5_9EURY|nr:desulfoferrodoxin [Methanofollis tationis]NVO67610.1 desulfoferrodoxin [Methanofollis tationis]